MLVQSSQGRCGLKGLEDGGALWKGESKMGRRSEGAGDRKKGHWPGATSSPSARNWEAMVQLGKCCSGPVWRKTGGRRTCTKSGGWELSGTGCCLEETPNPIYRRGKVHEPVASGFCHCRSTQNSKKKCLRGHRMGSLLERCSGLGIFFSGGLVCVVWGPRCLRFQECKKKRESPCLWAFAAAFTQKEGNPPRFRQRYLGNEINRK